MANIPVGWADGTNLVWADGTTLVVWSEEGEIEPPPNPPTGGVVTEAKGADFATLPFALELQPGGTQAFTGDRIYCRAADNWNYLNVSVDSGRQGLFAGQTADQATYSDLGAEVQSGWSDDTFTGTAPDTIDFVIGIKTPWIADAQDRVVRVVMYDATGTRNVAGIRFAANHTWSLMGGLFDPDAKYSVRHVGFMFDATTGELFEIWHVSMVATSTAGNVIQASVRLDGPGVSVRCFYCGVIRGHRTPQLIVLPTAAQSPDTFSDVVAQTVDQLTLRAHIRPYGTAQAPAGGDTVDAVHVRNSVGDDPQILIRRDTMTGTPRLVVITTVGASSRTDVIDGDLTSVGDDEAWWRIAVSVGDGNIRITSSRDGAAWVDIDEVDARDWSAKAYNDITHGGDAALLGVRSTEVRWDVAQSLSAMKSGW